MDSLAFATGVKPTATGVIKQSPEDFQVDELLGFDPMLDDSANGPHYWLHLRKTGINTRYLAELLARQNNCKLRDVGFSGMKDRHAVTTQWFSIPVKGTGPIVEQEGVELIKATQNRKKLKRGVHRENRFKITIRDLQGFDENVLRRIKREGVPNYFGAQRFGHRFGNLPKAEAMFANALQESPRKMKRDQRSLYLSAARSFLFNQIVSARLANGSWMSPMGGEPMNLDGSGSVFVPGFVDGELSERLASGDIHTTGSMWGAGSDEAADNEIVQFERDLLSQWPVLRDGLVNFGLQSTRRPLRMMLKDFTWHLTDSTLELNFTLGKGAYATSVLREILAFTDASKPGATSA
jgi:tRNA pseudouridine13 synthase